MTLNKKFITLIFLFIPILFWIITVYCYSVNVPWFDDFDPFSDFLRQWITNESWTERVALLFQPNNEHRMVFGKLVTAILYGITGKLNFSVLHWAGAAYTLGTLFIFWKIFQKSKWPALYFLPVPFLLFQLHYYLIFHWAICSHQHQPVVFFVSLSMYLLATKRFTWAIAAAICATYAMSNGIFVWVSGMAVLLFHSQWKQAGIWLLFALVAVGFYFRGMESLGNESSIDFFLQHPHLSFLGFFAFLGGLFEIYPSHASVFLRSLTPVIFGLLVNLWVFVWLAGLLLTWLKNIFTNRPTPAWASDIAHRYAEKRSLSDFVLGFTVFLLANALVIGFLRPRFGFFVMIVSNYKIYPALFLIVAYLSFLCAVPGSQRKAWFTTMAAAVLIWGISIFNYMPDIAERRKYLLTNAYNQEHHGYGLGHQPGSPAAAYVDQLMNDLVSRGVYQYPDTYNDQVKMMETTRNPLSAAFDIKTEHTEDQITVSETNFPYRYGYDTGLIVFFRKEDNLYLFKMNPRNYTGKLPFKHFEKGFYVNVPVEALPPGTYDMGLFYALKDKKPAAEIIQKITIGNR